MGRKCNHRASFRSARSSRLLPHRPMSLERNYLLRKRTCNDDNLLMKKKMKIFRCSWKESTFTCKNGMCCSEKDRCAGIDSNRRPLTHFRLTSSRSGNLQNKRHIVLAIHDEKEEEGKRDRERKSFVRFPATIGRVFKLKAMTRNRILSLEALVTSQNSFANN